MKNYTINEISEELGVSGESIRRLIRQGYLQAEYIGKSYYVSEEYVRKLFESKGRSFESFTSNRSMKKSIDCLEDTPIVIGTIIGVAFAAFIGTFFSSKASEKDIYNIISKLISKED